MCDYWKSLTENAAMHVQSIVAILIVAYRSIPHAFRQPFAEATVPSMVHLMYSLTLKVSAEYTDWNLVALDLFNLAEFVAEIRRTSSPEVWNAVLAQTIAHQSAHYYLAISTTTLLAYHRDYECILRSTDSKQLDLGAMLEALL